MFFQCNLLSSSNNYLFQFKAGIQIPDRVNPNLKLHENVTKQIRGQRFITSVYVYVYVCVEQQQVMLKCRVFSWSILPLRYYQSG